MLVHHLKWFTWWSCLTRILKKVAQSMVDETVMHVSQSRMFRKSRKYLTNLVCMLNCGLNVSVHYTIICCGRIVLKQVCIEDSRCWNHTFIFKALNRACPSICQLSPSRFVKGIVLPESQGIGSLGFMNSNELWSCYVQVSLTRSANLEDQPFLLGILTAMPWSSLRCNEFSCLSKLALSFMVWALP